MKKYINDISELIEKQKSTGKTTLETLSNIISEILTNMPEQRGIMRLAMQNFPQLSEKSKADFNQLYHEKFINQLRLLLKTGMEKGEFQNINADIVSWILLGMLYPFFRPEEKFHADIIDPLFLTKNQHVDPPVVDHSSRDNISQIILNVFFNGLRPR